MRVVSIHPRPVCLSCGRLMLCDDYTKGAERVQTWCATTECKYFERRHWLPLEVAWLHPVDDDSR